MVPPSGSEPAGKDPAAFRTIREVSEQLGVPQHVLRFWETRFPELKPLQRGGNRRYYRPGDIAFAAALHKLLHQDGYTVKGVRKLISDHGAGNLVAIANAGTAPVRSVRTPEPQPAPQPAPAPPVATQAAPAGAGPDDSVYADLRLLRDRLAAALAA
jgi:DNA-binding transcriptional MerR regulator